MTPTITYCKALLLLVVFSLNSAVGFACSLGGFFHSLHHQASSGVAVTDLHHQTSHGEHDHEERMHHEHNSDGSGKVDDCCSDQVSEVEKVVKSVSRLIEAPKHVFLSSDVPYFSSSEHVLPIIETTGHPNYVRWRILATIPDLRIAIQSFQI